MAQRVRTHAHVRIEAPRDLVWSTISDLELQPVWMSEVRSVDLSEGDVVSVGIRMRVPTRLLGLRFTDEVEITALEPPHRWAIEHLGPLVRGVGEFQLVSDDDGAATIVYWTEEIEAPFGLLGEFTLTAVQPLLRRRFESDLSRLRRLVESESRRSESA